MSEYDHLNPAEIKADYYNPRMTLKTVAAKYGFRSPQYLSAYIKKHGIPNRSTVGIKYIPTLPDLPEFLAAYEASTTIGKLTARYKTEKRNVESWIDCFGLVQLPTGVCGTCNRLAWCKVNPYADQLPCELEASTYAAPDWLSEPAYSDIFMEAAR